MLFRAIFITSICILTNACALTSPQAKLPDGSFVRTIRCSTKDECVVESAKICPKDFAIYAHDGGMIYGKLSDRQNGYVIFDGASDYEKANTAFVKCKP